MAPHKQTTSLLSNEIFYDERHEKYSGIKIQGEPFVYLTSERSQLNG